MKGMKPILTVKDLMDYLERCSPEAEVLLMPEDGEGMRIGGVLDFVAETPQQVWILFDEFTDASESPSAEWVSGPADDDDDDIPFLVVKGAERPGDMSTAMACEEEKQDTVKIRGKMRQA